ncbi:spermidine exporter, MDR-type pump [Scheffersomyces xylosifermentans]|uniref:spermidine exporter, MDR-type pump n=1 Tax=Scheffersomyces xylosifermentans TaxID=1304137 RepID=UPI00315D2A52
MENFVKGESGSVDEDRTPAPLSESGPTNSLNSSQSLSSYVSSELSTGGIDKEPIALNDYKSENEDNGYLESIKRKSPDISRKRSNTPTLKGGRRLSSLHSRGSLDEELSRQVSRYSVRDIYGDMNENNIQLQRTKSRSTILTTLSNRVQNAQIDAEMDKDDAEANSAYQETGFYEKTPDISVPVLDFGGEFNSIDPELVTWEGKDDPKYPRNWSQSEKLFQLFIVSLYTLVSPMSSSMLSPAMQQIGEDLGMRTPFIAAFTVSIMILAFAIGPLMIAPLSESDNFGRRTVLNASIWIIFVFNLACAFATTTAQLCIFRFLGGLGGCAALNVGAGTLADLFSNDERQVAMAAYSLCPSLGPVISPLVAGFIIENKSWHWVFYVLAIFNGAVAVFGTIFFKETYSPKLLKRKAQKLRKETGNNHLHTIFEIADGETAWEKFSGTIRRPLVLLCTHPMVIGLGSFMAFVYGFLYLMIVTFPDVYTNSYGFSVGISGLMYIPLGVGSTIGVVFWTIAIDKVYYRMAAKNGGVAKPEYRLPCLCFSGIGVPVGLIWYGWSAQNHLHWIMPSIGSALFSFSVVAVFQTIQNYLIDMNNRFAASSVAAAAVFRSVFGFAFPLFADKMYDRLDYGWGNTMCAFIALALGIPFPVFCIMYGERLRNWSNRRMDSKQAKKDARNLARLQAINEIEDTKPTY